MKTKLKSIVTRKRPDTETALEELLERIEEFKSNHPEYTIISVSHSIVQIVITRCQGTAIITYSEPTPTKKDENNTG